MQRDIQQHKATPQQVHNAGKLVEAWLQLDQDQRRLQRHLVASQLRTVYKRSNLWSTALGIVIVTAGTVVVVMSLSAVSGFFNAMSNAVSAGLLPY